MRVRRLRADEWQGWREFRLAMLDEAPYAFESTYAEAVTFDDDTWRARAARLGDGSGSCYLLAEDEQTGEWLAGAGGYTDEDTGIPNVFGVWTRPDARGQGYADACVRAVVEWARGTGAKEVRLWATDGNDAARRVYERLGFAPNGVTKPLSSDPTKTESEYTLAL